MLELEFGIAAYAGWSAHDDESAEIIPAPPGGSANAAERPPLPPMLRRRIGPIGQAALRLAWALPQVESARLIFASRHGEFDRSLAMLQQVADGDAPSPADFSLGVHNALAGLLSVCTRNRLGHTALAAGVDSFGFALVEAGACLLERPEEPVVLVYFDTALPQGYPDSAPACAEPTLAIALALVPSAQATRRVVMTATPAIGAVTVDAAASVFLRFLRTAAAETGAAGERMHWSWRHV